MRILFNPLLLTVFISALTFLSCSGDVNTCDVSNPTEEIDWLKSAIDEVSNDEYAYYGMATYRGETIFYYGNCNPVVNYASFVLNCDGGSLGFTIDLLDELMDMTIVWQHEDSKCDF